MMPTSRKIRGAHAYAKGLGSEALAARTLEGQGYIILGQRVRTPCGEIDLIVADADWVIAVEVKQRRTLYDGAEALSSAQAGRLLAAFDYVLATRPEWARLNTRFDLIIVDKESKVRRVQDVLRLS